MLTASCPLASGRHGFTAHHLPQLSLLFLGPCLLLGPEHGLIAFFISLCRGLYSSTRRELLFTPCDKIAAKIPFFHVLLMYCFVSLAASCYRQRQIKVAMFKTIHRSLLACNVALEVDSCHFWSSFKRLKSSLKNLKNLKAHTTKWAA